MAVVADKVDRLTGRRAWFAICLGAFVASRSTSIFVFYLRPGGLRIELSEGLSPVAWLIWFVLLLLFALVGGGLGRSSSVRQSLNDEGTVANWQAARLAGASAMVFGAAVCFFASFYLPLTARGAVQVIVFLGAGIALLRFGGLERRALHA